MHKVYLSTMKKGEGIDLVSADTVIITDHWWNRAAESQAIDRLHRIGQENDSVQVITLHAKDSIDEYMDEILKAKDSAVEAITVETEVARAIWRKRRSASTAGASVPLLA